MTDMDAYKRLREDFALAIPDDYNFAFDLIDRRAAERPDMTCLIAVNRDASEVRPVGYGEMAANSARFGNLLLSLGAAKGDKAVVMLPRIPAWFDTLFGCMKAGVVSMPGTNLLTAKDIAYRVQRSGARFAVVTQEHVEKIEQIRGDCPTLEHLILVGGTRDGWTGFEAGIAAQPASLSRDRAPSTRADDDMMIYFTSGTTSQPKMVPRDFGYALAHTITGRYWMDLREGDVHWTLTDTGWAKAAWGILFPPMLMGAAVVVYDGDAKFDTDLHLKLIQRLGVTTFCAPPTVYRLFAQTDLSGYDLTSLRHCLGAGEPLNPEVMRVWKQATGTEVHDGYGQTETINIVANLPGFEIRPGSMGRPVPGITVDVIDDDGQPVADDTIGHIAVKLDRDGGAYGLFRGYYDDEDTNARVFRHGWYYTGDTGRRDADGYIWFVGRADDIILSAGYRISPFEVESALIEHPAVAESAVIGKPDELRGEIVKAYVILAAGHRPGEALKTDIQDFVKKQTAPYKYPREIEFVDALPKTISGKIRRVELRAGEGGDGKA
ncbi:acyl-CoA synthetase [Marinibaculum pumilum]|uniref:Acyl-CoA synthetase n=1 Tax=Marinibaculum pumilum TaxID=1766165 RepID=A0ABV7KY66_9PROT